MILASTLIASTFFAQGSVTISGSDTMFILNQRLAQAYGEKSSVNVSVVGGGSGLGIIAFINRVTDIAASSRKMRASEVGTAKEHGALANEIPIALDGLAIAVNSSNAVKSLTLEQLQNIYSGRYRNWNQVGGVNAPIQVLSRDSNSGTFDFFHERVLKLREWGSSVRFMLSTSAEASEIAKSENAIGYGGLAYFKGNQNIKVLPVSIRAGSEPVMPTKETIQSKKYPIWRYLYYYTNGTPRGETKQFIDWVLSSEGQSVVDEIGYVRLKG